MKSNSTMLLKCCSCKLDLPEDCYVRDSSKRYRNGRADQCRKCRAVWYEANKERERAKGRAWHKAHPERSKRNTQNFKLQKKFGLTLEEYEIMFNSQGGLCAICSQPESNKLLAVDHNHDTKKVRGLLCSRCNTGIGQLREDPSLLERAVAYLRERN